MRRVRTLALVLIAGAAAGVAAMVARGTTVSSSPGPHPPNAKFRGLSYEEWEARWWQAGFALPIVDGDHPFISGGAFGGDKKVVFLAAPVGVATTIEITIRPGTALFFPIINAECSVFEPDPFHGDDEDSLRDCANTHIDNTSGVFAEIDGVPVKKLQNFRFESPLFEWGPLPEDNIFSFFGLDAPAGTTSPAVDAGYYLLLTPLSVGEHTIHIEGTFGGVLSGFVDTTFIVNVTPK